MHGCLVGGCIFLLIIGIATEALAAFERQPAGPEAAASGEIRSVGGDPVFSNPAALSRARGFHASLWGSHPFGIPEIHESQAAFWFGASRAGVGTGFRQFGSPSYFERELRLSCSIARRDSAGREPVLAAGACGRLLLVGGEAFPMHIGYGADLGLRVSLDSQTTLGVHLESLAASFPGPAGRLLSRSSLGVTRSLPARLHLLLEIARRSAQEPSVAAGIHWTPHELVIFRAGFRDEPAQLSWGLSVPLSTFLVSFSATETDPLGRTVRIGILWSRFSQGISRGADP